MTEDLKRQECFQSRHHTQWNSHNHYGLCGMNCQCCRFKYDGPDPCELCEKAQFDYIWGDAVKLWSPVVNTN